MAWVKLTSTMPWHRKVRGLSSDGFKLHVCAMCFSADKGTNGHILETDLPNVCDVKKPERLVADLVERGLWDRTEIGWAIHNYLRYNLSAEEGLALTVARTEAGVRGARIKANRVANAQQSA